MNSKFLCLLLLLAAGNLTAQTSRKTITAAGQRIEIELADQPNGRPVNYVVHERPQSASEKPVEKRMIVRLKGAPLIQNSVLGNGKIGSLENEHKLFKEDFQRIHQAGNSVRKSSIVPKLLYEYKNTFNGFSIITDTEGEQKIKELPYVESVTEDKKVEAIDNTSNQIIKADKVWADFNITGRGVVIGIIDTGIDYTHPDLGGSMGAGSKVIGGYDFVNEDGDPMDDHGHGTHVAGIAAANGTIKGVAPDAKLVAFKVLSSGGWGYDSWILAAIERTVDPDQNPNTNDALDVVNMSLGRFADPNEPYSEAIDNATLAGVTFVVAAGNNYDYQSVGTPGVAESAITVAATDQFDVTAVFSSKGPTEHDYRIKPDVAAPGVDIYSTFLNGAYQTLSGTSMASPHVAGAAALLLEKNPSWTPEIIKSALMQTAEEFSNIVWTQGAGRINVLDALQQDVVITPGSISLGLLEGDENWSKTAIVSVQNLSDQSKNISFQIDGNIIQSAITHTISPSSLILAPMERSTVTITFDVIPSQLPFLDFISGYFGKLIASYDDSTIESNIALVNPKRLKVSMTGEMPGLIIAVGTNEGNYTWKPYHPSSSTITMVLPDGTYYLSAQYPPNYYVVREGLSNNEEIDIDKSEATNKIVFKPIDKEGAPINVANYSHFGTVNLFAYNLITFTPYLVDTIFISNSNLYKIDFNLTDIVNSDPGALYNISKTTGTGISGSMTLSNNPGDFTEIDITVPGIEPQSDLYLTHYSKSGIPRSIVSTTWNSYPILIKDPLRILCSKNESEDIAEAMFVKLEPISEIGKPWETGAFKAIKPDGLVFFDNLLIPKNSFSNISQFNYSLGQTLSRFGGEIFIQENQIFLSSYFDGLFNHNYSDRQNKDIHYSVRDNNGTSIKEGSLQNGSFENTTGVVDVNQPFRQLILEYEHPKFLGIEQKSTATFNFNENNVSKDPPLINLLSLEQNGVSVNSINSDESLIKYSVINNYLDFIFYIQPGIKKSTLSIRKNGEATWNVLPTSFDAETNIHTAVQQDLLGIYDIKIFAEDLDGNSLTYELTPGFVAGTGTIESKTAYAYPNPLSDQTTVSFFTSNPGEVSFEIFSAQGQLIHEFTNRFESAGQNSIVLTDELKTQGMFFCRISSGDKIETIKLIVSR